MGVKSGAQWLFKKGTSLGSLFLFALVAHLVDVLVFQFSMNYAYYRLVIWVFVWFMGYGSLKEDGLDPRTLGFTLLFSAFSFCVPILSTYLRMVFPTTVSNGIVVFAPIWIVYILYFSGLDEDSGLHKIGVLYMLVWMVVCIAWGIQMGYMNTLTNLQGDKIDVLTPIKSLYAMLKESWNTAVKGSKELANRTTNSANKYFNDINGGSYTGTVDSNAKEKLGVYIEKIDKSQNDYYKDEPVSAWANIVAKTFDKPIIIQVNCKSDKGTKNELRADKLTPANRFEVLAYDENDLDCYFAKNSFEPGSHTISFLVNFSFQTFAYQKFYIVDKSRAVSALQNENKDILDFYWAVVHDFD